ncbi:MAG: DnaA regulatory inactivator Hda [Pseudomonadota bacterium]|nr:DnaA regulatory inactivator Hda [Pseudomonadota bacterium]
MTVGNTDVGLQLPLAISLRPRADFDSFVVGRNAELVNLLRRISVDRPVSSVWIHGPEGRGKTHLLQAICHALGQSGETAVYLPMGEIMGLSAGVFAGIERNAAVLCLDDVEVMAGHPRWEHALFDLYNRAGDAQTTLVLAAHAPPLELNFGLADLRSRLAASVVYRLHALSDADKVAALCRHAQGRGLDLAEPVARYLVAREPRDLVALFGILDRLDRASLEAKRRLTVPFVRRVLD